MTEPTLPMLGRRPADHGKPRLFASDFFVALPEHPLVEVPPDLVWPMDRNNQAGDCVVAGLDHFLQVVSASLGVVRTNWTDEQLLAYYQTQNPNFTDWSQGGGPDDGGMLIQDFLSYLVKQGVILGFAAVPTSDADKLRAATYLGLGLVTGETLQVAQQRQVEWDYVPGSATWGGHCTVTVGYDSDSNTCVTWGGLTRMTNAFVQNCLDEAWMVITQAHVDHPGFRNSFDLAGFANAYKAITGRDFPVPVPAPEPVPAPPAPTPTPEPPAPPAPEPTPVPPVPVDPVAEADAALVAAGLAWEPTIFSKFTKAGKFKAAFNMWKVIHRY